MANTRADVAITEATWVDLYAASGIAVGTAVTVVNKGSQNCLVAASLAAPASTSTGFPLWAGNVANVLQVGAGELGLWAYCPDSTTKLLVQE